MAIANQVIYNNFVHSFGASGTTYQHTTVVRHKGTVIAFAMDQSRQICYSVLNLENRDIKSPLDKDFWTMGEAGRPKVLPFSNEIAEVGFGIADQTLIPTILKDSNRAEPKPGQRVPDDKKDPFLSTTARFTADAPFQVLSDNQYVYVFRQSINGDHGDNVMKRDRSGAPVLDANQKPVPLVDSTLLADRFILSGIELKRKREVRFQRSRSKTRPQSRKDSLGTKDLEENEFFEPTQELRFVRRLQGGKFAVVLLPTQVVGMQRWQIFAYNSVTQQIDAYNVERSKDGLFNTQGSHIYTCEDHPEVYSLVWGQCTLTSLIDSSKTCDKPLAAIAQKSGYAESCLVFDKSGSTRIELSKSLITPQNFTFEAWMQPANPVQASDQWGLLTTDTVPDNNTPFSVWIENGTRLRIGFGDGERWQDFVTPGLLQPGQWSHVAIAFSSRESSTPWRVYIDGRLRFKSAVLQGKTAPNTPIRYIGATENSFQGKIDEIRFWSRTLTPSTIQGNFHQRLIGQEPDLLAYWRLDETSASKSEGTVVYDYTDHGYEGTLQGTGWQWDKSDAEIGEAPGISRNRFRIEGRSVISGMTALLYYQQIDMAKVGETRPVTDDGSNASSTDPQAPLKQNARLMLAFATQAHPPSAEDKPYIAALDFAVVATGRLAQAPDVLPLQPIQAIGASSKKTVNDQLEEIQSTQGYIRSLEQELAAQLSSETIRSIKTAIDAVEVDSTEPSRFSSTDLPGFKALFQDFYSAWDAMKKAKDELDKRLGPLKNAWVEVYENTKFDGKSYRINDLSTSWDNTQKIYRKVISTSELQKNQLAENISSLKTGNTKFTLPDNTKTDIFKVILYQNPVQIGTQEWIYEDVSDLSTRTYEIEIEIEIEKKFEFKKVTENWDNRTQSLALEEVEGYIKYRAEAQDSYEDRIDEFNTKKQELGNFLEEQAKFVADKEQELADQKTTIKTIQNNLKDGLSVSMPVVYLDPQGLTVAGAILEFAWTKNTPVLFDSAIGKLGLYFQGTDNQFFVAYYRTLTQRARYPFMDSNGSPALTFYARSMESELDDVAIAISNSTTPETCTITITLNLPPLSPDPANVPPQNLVETWQHVPRNLEKLAKVINGQAIQRELMGWGQLIIEEGRIQSLRLTKSNGWMESEGAEPWFPARTLQSTVPAGSNRAFQGIIPGGMFFPGRPWNPRPPMGSGSLQPPIGSGPRPTPEPSVVLRQRTLRAGTFLRIGENPLRVTQDVTLTYKVSDGKPEIIASLPVLIPVESTSLTLPDDELPIFFLEYDYTACAGTTQTPSDLENGSMLVAAVVEKDAKGAIANGTSPRSETLACQWVASAPGTTLSFDGEASYASSLKETFETFAFERDLTVEAWIRPKQMKNTGTILASQVNENLSYTLGLQRKESLSAFRINAAYSFLPIFLRGAFTLECWCAIPAGSTNANHLGVLFPVKQFFMEPAKVPNTPALPQGIRVSAPDVMLQRPIHAYVVVALKWAAGADTAELVLLTTGDKLQLERVTSNAPNPPKLALSNEVDRWYHIAVTWDGTAYQLFVNGRPFDRYTLKPTQSLPEPLKSLEWVEIGELGIATDFVSSNPITLPDGFTLTSFSGWVDQLKIWRRKRKIEEIRGDIFLRLSGNEPGLELYLTLEKQLLVDISRQQRLRKELTSTDISKSPILPAYSAYLGINNLWVQTKTTILTGTWSHIAAVFNQSFALKFDGKTGYLTCNDPGGVLNITSELTLEVFLQINNLETSAGLLCKGQLGDSSSHHVPYALWINADGSLEFVFETEKGNQLSCRSSTQLKKDTFYHVVVTRKQEGTTGRWDTIQFYVNREVAGTGRQPSGGNYAYDDSVGSSEQPLTIGCWTVGEIRNGFFDGKIAEVRIWNIALEAKKIGIKPDPQEKGLVAWWRLEDHEGFAATDSKGNNHAQLKEGVEWTNNPDPKGSTLTLYLNGVVVETEPLLQETSDLLKLNQNQFTIGATKSNTHTRCFQGELEELRIWQVARTQEQLLDNLFQRVLGDREQLIAHYTFDVKVVDPETPPQALEDHSFRGNNLTVNQPNYIYSTAPIGDDIPLARSALAGFRTVFHSLIESPPAVMEYGDLQYDANGVLFGVLKRCYTFIDRGQWYLVTGFKVGNLVTQWLGQVQFNPQIKGFIEGAPPVPSENLTDTGYVIGEVDDYTDASTVELEASQEQTYTYSLERNRGFDLSSELFIGAVLEKEDVFEAKIGLQFNTEFSQSWLDDASVETSVTAQKNTQMQLRGYFENTEDKDGIRHSIGRRFVPENMGMALVESETVDIFTLRLEHNNALVCYQIRPNPDIPKDWNIITFPINPHYTKQGTLDGKVGNEADIDYPNALTHSSDISYFKPIEAYAIKNRIDREEEELKAYYEQYNAADIGTRDDAITRMGGSTNLRDSLPDVAKRNLVNTYVWTADGGLFAETQQTLDVRQETTGGSYEFKGMAGIAGEFTGFGVGIEAKLLLGGHFNLTATKSLQSQEGFSLNVSLDKVEGTIYDRTRERNVVLVDGKPKKKAGKVDAYRFMSFYLEPRPENHDLFFNQVVDQQWLRESGDPNAQALLQAEQNDQKPPCWRIMHRVTYVSRILPEFDKAAPLEKTMKALELESNYELVKTLDPFVRNKTNSLGEFAQAVQEAIAQYLPELQPHTPEILQWLTLYYGVIDDAILLNGITPSVNPPDLPPRGTNVSPSVDAGPDLTLRVDESVTLKGAVRDDRHASEDIFVSWSLPQNPEITIQEPYSLTPRVQFSQKGLYRLTLVASDGYRMGEDEMTVTVNEPPVISAGVDQVLRVGEQTTLDGQVLNSGLGDPASTELTIEWLLEGKAPGIATFENRQNLKTGVTFSKGGRYELKLTVSNGSFEVSDTIVIMVGMRSTRNLLALYLFGEGTGTLVQDVSGTEPPLNLTILNPTATRWGEGKLSLSDRTLLTSTLSTQPLVQALQSTDEITLEAWIQPSAEPTGLARIVTLSKGPGDRNVTLGQTGNTYQFCLRTTETNANASTQVLAGTASSSNQETHVVCTRDASGNAWLYINGQPVSQRSISGTFANWEPGFPLALGNEVDNPDDTHPRAWLGTFNLVALYNHALSPEEIADHYGLGANPDIPPVVDVGPDRVVNRADAVVLSGTVHHEKFLTKTVSTQWVQLKGPKATLENPNALSTAVSFEAVGIYEFKLVAESGEQIASDKLRIVVNDVPQGQVKVLVNDKAFSPNAIPPLKLSDQVRVIGEVLRSGLGDPQEGTLTTHWHQPSSAVTIVEPLARATALQFTSAGNFTVQWVMAHDTAETVIPLTFIVNEAPTLHVEAPAIVTLPDRALVRVGLDTRKVFSGADKFRYRARQLQGPEKGIDLSEFSSTPPSVTEPRNIYLSFQKSGVYEIEVIASNGDLVASQRFTITANAAPVVNAGGDRTIILPQTAMLDAIVSDDGLPNPPGKVTLQWSHISVEAGNVRFTQPTSDYTEAIFSAKGRYRIGFTADDDNALSRDELDVVVNTVPVIQLTAPPLITLPDPVVLTGQVLDDGLGDPTVGRLTCIWEQVQGADDALLTDTTANTMTPTASVSFVQGGRYTFRLTVHNGYASASATVTVLANVAPVVFAGPDQVVNLLDTVTLQGILRDDLLPQETLVEWTQVSPEQPHVQFRDGRSLTTPVTFPTIGVYVLRLTGNDGAATAFDELTILVNKAPVIEAIAPPLVTIPGTVILTGRIVEEGRGDPQQGSITSTWIQIAGPGTASIEPANSLTPTVSLPHSGEYTFELTVSNGFLYSSARVSVVANQAPVVDAGIDQLINLPGTVTLAGTVLDDGWPQPPGAVTVNWSKVSGPGNVTFGAQAAQTTASFSQSGIYTLRLTATDGAIAAYDDLTIIANQPPIVDAGATQRTVRGQTITLTGTVTDDQLPPIPGFVTTQWSVVSGPGEVTLDQPNALITRATFPVAGIYVLRLTANDGAAIAQDDVTINVSARVTDGLIALYTFQEGSGSVIRDRSNYKEAMDLVIEEGDRNKVRWLSPGGLVVLPANPVVESASIRTRGPATKVIRELKESNQMTVEVWYRPGSDRPIFQRDNPIRILSIAATGSAAHWHRNFTLQQGQWKKAQANFYHTRLRTPSNETSDEEGLQTDVGTIKPAHITREGTSSFKLNHVVYTWDGKGQGCLYVDGVLMEQEVFKAPKNGWGNTFAGWNDQYQMALARDPSGTWPGRGEFYLVAIYRRTLSQEEVIQNYEAKLDNLP